MDSTTDKVLRIYEEMRDEWEYQHTQIEPDLTQYYCLLNCMRRLLEDELTTIILKPDNRDEQYRD